MNNTVELLRFGADCLRGVTDRARLEAEILLSFCTGLSRSQLIISNEVKVNEEKYRDLISRRANYEPMEYIFGKVSFYAREFICEHGVLIPRPETELLIDHTVQAFKHIDNPVIYEIGTGSGVIAIMLALLRHDAQIIATDIDEKAITLAQKNAAKFEVSDRITFVQTSYLDGVGGKCDIVVSNPPYIAQNYPLNKTVLFEPKTALIGGKTGVETLLEIISLAAQRGVALACECGYDQKSAVSSALKKYGYKHIAFYNDYAGHFRGFSAQ